MRVTRMTLLLAGALAAPAALAAQGPPDLSGTWVLQLEQSDLGAMTGQLQARTDVIEHKEPSLKIKRTVRSTAGENISDLVYMVDGKPWKNTAGPTEITSTLRWEAGALVMVSTVPNPQGEVTITDRYTLSADGKTLTQARVLSLGGQEVAQKMVLTKQ
jgi:hypothetical protein